MGSNGALMTEMVWERDTIATSEDAVPSAEGAGKRAALLGLRRAWPTSVFCGICKMKAEEESGPAAGVQEGTNGSAAGEEIVVG